MDRPTKATVDTFLAESDFQLRMGRIHPDGAERIFAAEVLAQRAIIERSEAEKGALGGGLGKSHGGRVMYEKHLEELEDRLRRHGYDTGGYAEALKAAIDLMRAAEGMMRKVAAFRAANLEDKAPDDELAAANAIIERVRALLTSKEAPGMKGRPTCQGDIADDEWRAAIKKALGDKDKEKVKETTPRDDTQKPK